MGEQVLLLMLICVFNLDLARCRKFLCVSLGKLGSISSSATDLPSQANITLQSPVLLDRAEACKCLFLSRCSSVVEELIRDLSVVCPGREVGSLPVHRALASFAVSPCGPAARAAGGCLLRASLLLNVCDGFRWGLRLTGIISEQRSVVHAVGTGCCGVVWDEVGREGSIMGYFCSG